MVIVSARRCVNSSTSETTIRIATRASALALWQAHHVADLLRAQADVQVEFVGLTTTGDQRTDVPISVIGGKGVFVKEVQAALLDGRADIAVHSAKDLQALTPDGLVICAVPERGDPRDVLIGSSIEELAAVANPTVATGSARRRVQVQHLLAQANVTATFAELRGRIETRLEKSAGFNAIVMASAALERLGLTVEKVHTLSVDEMVPQVGQGTLAVECRADDADIAALMSSIDHAPSHRLLDAERGFLLELGGDCDLPAGAHATFAENDEIRVTGVMSDMDGANLERATHQGTNGPEVGAEVARRVMRNRPSEPRG